MFKQTLGWTRPRLRGPEAAGRWTWLIIAATPSEGWPGASSRTYGTRGRNRLTQAGSPQPESADILGPPPSFTFPSRSVSIRRSDSLALMPQELDASEGPIWMSDM